MAYRLKKIFGSGVEKRTIALFEEIEKGRDCDQDKCKRLIAKGVDINATDDVGFTALHKASCRDLLDVARALLDAGADIDAKNKNNNRTPLQMCLVYGKNLYVDKWDKESPVAPLLVERGASLNVKDGDGWTPLMHAVNKGWRVAAKKMIAHGADIEIKNKRGFGVRALAFEIDDEGFINLVDQAPGIRAEYLEKEIRAAAEKGTRTKRRIIRRSPAPGG